MKEKVIEVPCANILKLREYLYKYGKVKAHKLEVRWTPKKVKRILTEDDIKRCKDCRLKVPGGCWVLELLGKS